MKYTGQKISAPGMYDRVPMEAYHSDLCAGPSISSSGLRTIFNESPAHYWVSSYLNPERIVPKDTDAFILGRAAHHLLLGEDDFSTLFICRPDQWDSWRTNDAKKWKAEQEQHGRTVLLPSQLDQIRGMAKSLAANGLIKYGILNGDIEQSLVWPDEETSTFLKARPDAIPNDSGDFADLKTCFSVSDDALRRTLAECSYHQQAALVAEGWRVVTGRPITSFSLVFVEKSPPYCSRVVTLKDCDLERGAKQNRLALRTFAQCLQSGEWPGPGRADAEFIELPEWAQTRIDAQLQFMGAT